MKYMAGWRVRAYFTRGILAITISGLTACGGGSGGNDSGAVASNDRQYILTAVQHLDSASTAEPSFDVQMVDPRSSTALGLHGVASATTIMQGRLGTDGTTLEISPHHLLYLQNGLLRRISLGLSDHAPQPVTLQVDGVCRVSSSRTTLADPDHALFNIMRPGLDNLCNTMDDLTQLVRVSPDGSLAIIAEGVRKGYLLLGDNTPDTPLSWLTLAYANTTSAEAVVERLDSTRPGVSPIDFTALPDAPMRLIGRSTDALVLQGQQRLWLLDLKTDQPSVLSLSELATPQLRGENWSAFGHHDGTFLLLHQVSSLPDLRWDIHAVQPGNAGSRLIAQGQGIGLPQLGATALLLQQIDNTPANRISLLGLDGQPGPTLMNVDIDSLYPRWLGDDAILIESGNTSTPSVGIYDGTGQQVFSVSNARNLGFRLTTPFARTDLPRDEPQLLYLTGLPDGQPYYGTDLWLYDRSSGQRRHLGRLPDPASLGKPGTLSMSVSGTAGASGVLSVMRDSTTTDHVSGAVTQQHDTLAIYTFDTRQADSLRLVQPQ
ncbi:MAG: hypothetical protein AB9M60_20745 [Leptothrix sp. (in: b-proteobacteria)]